MVRDIDEWVNRKTLELFNWNTLAIKRDPSCMYSGSGLIQKMFRTKVKRIRTPGGKYIPVADRAKAFKKSRSAIMKELEAILKGRNYSLAEGIGVDIGKGITNKIKEIFKHPKFDKSQLTRGEQLAKIEAEYTACLQEYHKLVVLCKLGQCENPIAAFQGLEDKYLADHKPLLERSRKTMQWEPIAGGRYASREYTSQGRSL